MPRCSKVSRDGPLQSNGNLGFKVLSKIPHASKNTYCSPWAVRASTIPQPLWSITLPLTEHSRQQEPPPSLLLNTISMLALLTGAWTHRSKYQFAKGKAIPASSLPCSYSWKMMLCQLWIPSPLSTPGEAEEMWLQKVDPILLLFLQSWGDSKGLVLKAWRTTFLRQHFE